MKRILVLAIVWAMVSVAGAEVIDVVADGLGDMGHAGTAEDPLEVGETIGVRVVLNNNPYAGYPSYDGYVIDVMEVDLKSANGDLSIALAPCKCIHYILGQHDDWSVFDDSLTSPENLELAYASLSGIQAQGGPVDLIWNILATANGAGNIELSLERHWNPYNGKYGIVHVGNDYWPIAGGPGPSGDDWYFATEEDFGDLTLYVVPEPITIVLLGFGGLFIRKRN